MNIITTVNRDGYHLDLWKTGGYHYKVEPPEPPHFWSPYEIENGVECWKTKVRLFSNFKEEELFKVICDTVYRVRRARRPDSIEANIPFIQLLTLLYGFGQTDTDTTVAAFDIEAGSSSGQFPTADRDPVTAISYAEANGHEQVWVGDELDIMDKFCSCVEKRNPDILSTYNGARFDWKYLVDRGDVNGVTLPLGREDDGPYIKEIERGYGRMRGRDYIIRLRGRLPFDVYKEVRMDTGIQGRVPNKQLKTIATYFQHADKGWVIPEGMPIIRLSYKEQREAGPEELGEYCLSDSRLTAHLAEYYLRTMKDLATYIEAPLNLIVDRTPSHLGNYIAGRRFKRMGVVSDGINYDRFRGILWE